MKKNIILLLLVLLALACAKTDSNEKSPLQNHEYPCGMNFSFYSMLPPQKHGNTDDFIVHFSNEQDYTIIYACNKEISPMIKSQMQNPANAKYKKVINGRTCFKTDWEHSEGESNFYTNRVLCDNNGSLESLAIEIPLRKKNPQETKALAEEILTTVNFK